ncbi:MAG: DUF5069 domain-containing protein [Opitutales bacterium]|jgi:hypothetical protein
MTNLFHLELSRIWQHAVELYQSGHTTAATFPIDEEIPGLENLGLTKMDVFDYAEDWCLHQEPDFLTFLLVHYERWKYFTEIQQSVPSSDRLDPSKLPGKEEAAEGIVWLPRILPKARAKLRGELPPEVMYGCGGDRHFFQTNHVHPAQFLSVIRELGDNDQAIIDWVVKQKNSLNSSF